MSLSSVLRQTFLTFAKDNNLEKCLSINSIYKKPSRFYYDVYYVMLTNQLVVEGMVYPYGKDEVPFEVFQLIDHAPLLTLKQLIMDVLELVEDETDINLQGEENRLLEQIVCSMKSQNVWIIN